MYIRVKDQGGALAFVLVKSEREGTKVRQRFVCHLGSFPKGHDQRAQDLVFCAFLHNMHYEMHRLDLNPVVRSRLYEIIWEKIGKTRKRLRHEAKGRLQCLKLSCRF